MAAAADVAGIGSAISAANAAALAPTSVLAAAGADEVSAAVAALFSAHAGQYQQLGARAAWSPVREAAARTTARRRSGQRCGPGRA
nr:PE family protein [Mycobacterium tuberculosis]